MPRSPLNELLQASALPPERVEQAGDERGLHRESDRGLQIRPDTWLLDGEIDLLLTAEGQAALGFAAGLWLTRKR